MDRDAALTLLTLHTQADVEPVLTELELDVLLEEMQGVDVAGLAPADTGWVATYDRAALASAIVQGWEMKAAKAVPEVNWAADGGQFSASDVHEHCLAQADRWRKRVMVSIPVDLKPVRRIVL